MPARLFSIKDDLILKELYSKFTNRELVSVFNGQYSIKQIKFRGKGLGLLKDQSVKERAQQTRTGAWEEWENEIIRKHYSKDGIEFVCNILTERTKSSILHKAHRMGYKIPASVRKPRVSDYVCTDESRHKMSLARLGKPFSEEHKKNLQLGARRGENHPMWKDGRSKVYYGDDFTVQLKSEIKKRDSYQCKKCFKKPSWTKLIIHHIDYNKKNSTKQNLITLCKQCHVHHHLNISNDEQLKEQFGFNNYISGKS